MTALRVHPSHRSMLFLIAISALFVSNAGPQSAPPSTPAGANATTSAPVDKATAQSAPSFDVASIHVNNYDRTNHSHISSSGGSDFRAINVTALQLVQWAYNFPDSRITGAPSWLTSAKFDITAKSDPDNDNALRALPWDIALQQRRKMLQSLLDDRFHLTAHIETKTLPIFALVVGKSGPKFAPVKDGPKHVDVTGRSSGVTINITSSSHAMADLAEVLYRYTGRVVVDKTGLQGNYTISLKFAPDDSRAAVPNSDTSSAPDSGPSVFTALKEQLGLELKSDKGQVDILVIDHIDPPSEN